MSLLVPNRFDPADLFEKLVRSFGKNTASVVINGMHFHHMTALLKLTCKYMAKLDIAVHFRRAFYVEPDTLEEFWTPLKMHFADHGDGSVLIAVSGIMSHWSCIKKVHDDSFEMADGGIKNIDRTKTTIKKASTRRPIVLLPKQAVFINLC